MKTEKPRKKRDNKGNRTLGLRLATFQALNEAREKKMKQLGITELSWELFIQMMIVAWKRSQEEGLKNR